METEYLYQKEVIDFAFSNKRKSVFILKMKNEKLILVEQNIDDHTIIKRFKALSEDEMHIQNHNYAKIHSSSVEGHFLFNCSLSDRLLLVMPRGYIVVYDTVTAEIVTHFQCFGKKTYDIRSIAFSSKWNYIFFSAVNMRNIYCLDINNLSERKYGKFRFDKDFYVLDLVLTPDQNMIGMCLNEGKISFYDISKRKETFTIALSEAAGSCLSMDIEGDFVVSGYELGFIAVSSLSKETKLLAKKVSSGKILSLKFLKTRQFEDLQRFACFTSNGKLLVFSFKQGENSVSTTKICEINTFKTPFVDFESINVWPDSFLKVSYLANIVAVKNPSTTTEKVFTAEGAERVVSCVKVFEMKTYFIYDNDYPLINTVVLG